MNSNSVLATYLSLLEALSLLNTETEKKVIDETPDIFITSNINFFTKSFMITLCAYLESFLKDLTMMVVDDANMKLSKSKVAYNLVKWSVMKKKELQELNENELKFEALSIKITRRELNDFISASPYKTEKLFNKLGIKLLDDKNHQQQREKIVSVVEKRNKIVHHNDNASDISFADIQANISFISAYITNLNKIIMLEPQG